MRPEFALVAAVLSGCIISVPSADSDGGATRCADRTGSYVARFVEQSGTCGPLPDQVLTIQSTQSGQAVPAGCTGTVTPSSDNCTVQVDMTCPGEPGTHVTQQGQATWSTDASSGSATLQVSTSVDADGSVTCSSSYAVSYTRQALGG
jgi:hypothetical protein